ncbi:hypothetical protein EV183_005659 [Coemansia sp. RSA 2336]|nr:hypothetical protein EV183_005659 [Coemansia sp. RSA 2336]
MEDGRISTLLNLLIDRYKNNLVDIATKAGQANLVEVPRLRRVKIMFSRSVDLTFSLQICDTVEYLNLAIVPHEYLCSLFGSHGSPKVFPNLQYLNVYSPLDCIDSATEELVQRHISCSRLYLPKLRSLILVNNYKYCPILSTAVLPRQMDILSVSVSPQTIMMLAKSAIPQVQQLSIQQHMCTDIERGSTVAALRHIFHQTSIAANAMLTFDSPTRSIMPSELGGACITYLSVRRGVTLTMLAEFMNSLYALTRLEAHLCQQCKSELELATPDKAEHPLRPFAARINYFRLDYDYSTDSIVPFIRYILPRLPHIETLDSYMTFREPIVQFVEEYKSLYPHLSIVKLVLNPSNLW